jgi:pyrroline-5-carboxylate reductase
MTIDPGGRLLLIGAGKMGGAMLAGWLDGGLDPAQVAIADPTPAPEIVELAKVRGLAAPVAAYEGEAPAVIVLAIKPQMLDGMRAELAPIAGPRTLIVSVLAGKTLDGLATGLAEGAPIVRAMPNTPSAVGRGMTAAIANAHVDATQREVAAALLGATGDFVWIEEEGEMDALTAISGCGPAYVFFMVESMAKAGVAAGLDADLAMRLARQTVAGAGELLHRSDLPAATLRQNVTSPNGVTARALDVLMAADGIDPVMQRAVDAAVARSRELAG